jgi:Phospholipase_D-nuclease N-terminal
MLTHGTLDPSQIIGPLILLLLDLIIVLYCLDDLLKPERRVAGGNKAVWAIILIFSGVGWVAYLLFGRERS